MSVRRLVPPQALACACLAACASFPPYAPAGAEAAQQSDVLGPAPESQDPRAWEKREVVLQGLLGVTLVDDMQRTGGTSPDVDGSDIDTLPLIGGGAQWKLGGERVDWGVEALFATGWRANATAFVAGGGGAVVAVDVDLFVVDFFGGPFASVFLGESTRVYAALGPLVQWGRYGEDDGTSSEDASGFGVGTYARGGIELSLSPGRMLGVGVRWFESELDLDQGLGDLELEGTQAFITLSEGF